MRFWKNSATCFGTFQPSRDVVERHFPMCLPALQTLRKRRRASCWVPSLNPSGFDERAFERALLELAGEAGDLAKRFIGSAYRDNVDALRGDLVKLLRPLGRAAAAAEVSLDEAGQKNMAKTQDRWPTEQKFPPLFDEGLHIDEQLPRLLRVEIYEREVNGKKFVFQKSGGILLGDRLTDNHVPEDDYRFHDVFHSHMQLSSAGRRQSVRS